MKREKGLTILLILGAVLALTKCQPDQKIVEDQSNTTPYNLVVPNGFPQPMIPADNLTTVEGVKLGRFLFYEKKLSGDQTQSCGSCHMQEVSFGDIKAKSIGIAGLETDRHAMVLFNLAWQEFFFWDGRTKTLEEQALEPVTNPIEMNADWPTVLARLEATPMYPPLFEAAFGDKNITKERVGKAIAQFERTIVSANSEYDRVKRETASGGLPSTNPFSDPLVEEGYQLFRSEDGDCFHCHGEVETSYLLGAFGKDATFRNNGLKADWVDEKGRFEVTGAPEDIGKMKVPTLRNTVISFGDGSSVALSAPFMHDGSIPTLDSLIEFYNFGGHKTATSNTDPNMKAAGIGRNWSPREKAALKAFLGSLTDFTFLEDTNFSDPFLN